MRIVQGGSLPGLVTCHTSLASVFERISNRLNLSPMQGVRGAGPGPNGGPLNKFSPIAEIPFSNGGLSPQPYAVISHYLSSSPAEPQVSCAVRAPECYKLISGEGSFSLLERVAGYIPVLEGKKMKPNTLRPLP
jgi:hypothetical protein